jgi:hypothetical protein
LNAAVATRAALHHPRGGKKKWPHLHAAMTFPTQELFFTRLVPP